MLPKFFKISNENFEANLNYFYITNNKIKHSLYCLNKFKEYTSEYCLKASKLFKEESQNFDSYEIIDSDYIENKKDNNVTNKNNESNSLSPIENSIERMNNFFDKLFFYLNDFVKNLEKQLKGIEQYLTISKNEMNSIKGQYEKQKDIFKSKYMEFKNLNNELKNNYYKGETKLIDFCYQIKLNGIPYDNNTKISFADITQVQNEIINRYNSMGNFGKEILESTKDKINSIQQFISSIFLKFENISNNILSIFKNSIMTPLNKIIEEKNNTNIPEDLEADLKKDLQFLLNNFNSNVDENKIKLKLDEYNIRVLENNKIKLDKSSDDKKEKEKDKNKKKDKKEKTHEKTNEKNHEKTPINNNPTEEYITLTDEEIFFIVNNMYQYKLINRSKYDLNIEEKKLELKQLIIKLLSFSNKVLLLYNIQENKNVEIKKEEEKKEITKEEVDYICKEMANEEYRKYFLTQINNFRTLGSLVMPEKIFGYFVQIFSEICKYLFIPEEKEGKKGYIKDYNSSRLIVIMPQTFYKTKNKEKIYISDELKTVELFHEAEFWKILIRSMIEKECKSLMDNQKIINHNDDKKRINNLKEEIYLAQIIPYIGSMNGFGLTKEEIKNIISDIILEYDMSEETAKNIMDVIDA